MKHAPKMRVPPQCKQAQGALCNHDSGLEVAPTLGFMPKGKSSFDILCYFGNR
jgi:hypothetical protein